MSEFTSPQARKPAHSLFTCTTLYARLFTARLTSQPCLQLINENGLTSKPPFSNVVFVTNMIQCFMSIVIVVVTTHFPLMIVLAIVLNVVQFGNICNVAIVAHYT